MGLRPNDQIQRSGRWRIVPGVGNRMRPDHSDECRSLQAGFMAECAGAAILQIVELQQPASWLAQSIIRPGDPSDVSPADAGEAGRAGRDRLARTRADAVKVDWEATPGPDHRGAR